MEARLHVWSAESLVREFLVADDFRADKAVRAPAADFQVLFER